MTSRGDGANHLVTSLSLSWFSVCAACETLNQESEREVRMCDRMQIYNVMTVTVCGSLCKWPFSDIVSTEYCCDQVK
jgi:hypothetical protein